MGESTSAKDISNAGEKKSDSSNRELLKEIEKRIGAGFSKFLIIFSLILFFATFIWVIFAAIVWPAENEKYFRIPLKGDDKRQLEVWGPAIVPGDEAFVEIQFTSHQESVSNTPLSLSVTIPEEFIILSPTSSQYAHKVNIQFDGMLADETRTLKVANAHIVQNLGVGIQNIVISVKGQTTEVDFFPLGAEGTWRTVLRQYGGGGSEFPVFPLTTLFVSVAGWAYREIQQRKQDKEKELEQQRKMADSQIKNVRSAIKDGQIELASQTQNELFQGELKQFIKANDLQTAGRLIRIALGNFSAEADKTFPDDWLEESAAALAYATEHNPKDRRALEALLREFPVNKIAQEEIRQKLESAKKTMGSSEPVQDRQPVYPMALALPKYAHPAKVLEINPFPAERAEDDIPYLFAEGKSVFWSEHPLLLKLLQTTHETTLISGNSGSGKTALALALGEYRYVLGERNTFSCYLRGTPRTEEICSTLASRLLAFIERLPSFLVLLNGDQRNLLAQTLVAELGKENVSGRLGYVSNPIRWKEWLDKADSDVRKIWEAETSAHLSLLRETVAALTPCAFTNHQWLIAFMSCLRSLEFEKSATLVIDADDDFNWDWYHETILRQQHAWSEVNLHTITFCATQYDSAQGKKENDWLRQLQLDWNKKQLQDMAEWRWKNSYERPPLVSLFEKDALDTFLQLSENNPRCFIRLWNALFQSGPKSPIEEETVRKTKEKITCN